MIFDPDENLPPPPAPQRALPNVVRAFPGCASEVRTAFGVGLVPIDTKLYLSPCYLTFTPRHVHEFGPFLHISSQCV